MSNIESGLDHTPNWAIWVPIVGGLLYTFSMKNIKYSEITTTTEAGAMCLPCSEYKGMVDCPECGDTFCVFCADGCESCGASIDFSS